MPDSQVGHQKVLDFIEVNDISIVDLATKYGMSKQDLTSYLTGRLRNNKKAHEVVLRIISDFKIR